MKNDEIRSINIKMKTLEKKSEIQVKENNYRIQQERNKYMDLEKKMEKLK